MGSVVAPGILKVYKPIVSVDDETIIPVRPLYCNMAETVTPAIVRDYDLSKDDVVICETLYDTVSFTRGFGESGYRVQTVEHECPACNFDRMIRRTDISPERSDEVRYWCLNPNCKHYVSDSLSYACKGSHPHRSTNEPTVFEPRGDA